MNEKETPEAKIPETETADTHNDVGSTEPKTEADTKEKPVKEKKDKHKAELADCKQKLASAESELADTKDKYLRTVAEYDNFRRRSQKEHESTYTDAVSDCIAEIVPFIDNLERAASVEGDAEKVRQGLEMTAKAGIALLEKMGVETFGTPGDTFNPAIHNAVMHVDDESLGENIITDVYQKGYRRGDRIIRYAMVRVAN